MRTLALTLVLAALSSSCGSPPKRLFARFDYIVAEPGSIIGVPRSLGTGGFDGDNGVQLGCSVTDTATARMLSFTFAMPAMQARLQVTGAMFAKSQNVQSAMGAPGCYVTAQEGNTYGGACGGSEPSDTQPCRINQVQFSVDPMSGDPVVVGRILCRNLQPTTTTSTIRRDVISTDSTMPMAGAAFTIFNCTGLAP